MKWLTAGLTYVNVATVAGVLLGMISGGLNNAIAVISLVLGSLAALVAFLLVDDAARVATEPAADASAKPAPKRRGKRAQVKQVPARNVRYRNFWFWVLVACFAAFALRSFCWLFYIDGNELKIQSPNNLGDLALHLTYIKTFANGTRIWPDNPIFVASMLRYPAGIDIFAALLQCAGFDLMRGFVWVGLLGCAATCYAFYRWAGTFGIAAFLFNGGLAGFQFVQTFSFLDYQGGKTIAWKSLPLSMLVTQRGLLYALPVGLLLLCAWRSRYFPDEEITKRRSTGPMLPLWLEVSLYATMPLFHVHTFLCLSLVLALIFIFGNSGARRQSLLTVGLALIPASFFVWLVSDNFQAGSFMKWKPGWVNQPGSDFAMPFPYFWLVNFGAWLPAVLFLVGLYAWQTWQRWQQRDRTVRAPVILTIAATVMFLITYFVKTAPWEWDNMKILVWGYFLVLPFLWRDVVKPLPRLVRIAVCIALFGSGFITLIGGLAAGREGFGIADRGELDSVGAAVHKLPLDARFAGFPTYNHPLLLQGRKMVMGYPGHLMSQGFDYSKVEQHLRALMLGQGDWRNTARSLGVRYLFWGKPEQANYARSTRPWERELRPVVTGPWGSIYDLEMLFAPGQ